MLSTGKKFEKQPEGKARERFGLEMPAPFKRELESFAQSFDIDLAEIVRSGASLYINGFLPVLGRIPCGPLSEAIEETAYHEVVPPYLKPRPADFLLEANGDSMSPRIERGDMVMLRPDIEHSEGEICAVIVTDESGTPRSTLKRLFLHPKDAQYELRPINPAYPSERVPTASLRVVGVYRGLLTKDG